MHFLSNKKKGGTAYTVDYANKQGLQVINLAKWRKEKWQKN